MSYHHHLSLEIIAINWIVSTISHGKISIIILWWPISHAQDNTINWYIGIYNSYLA